MFESFFKGKTKETEPAPLSKSKAEMEEHAEKNSEGPASFSAKDLIQVEEQQAAFEKNGWNNQMNGRDEAAYNQDSKDSINGSPIDYVPAEKNDHKSA